MRPGVRALAVLLLLAGCADFAPFDPPVAGEMRPGAGLFSGPDGVFVLSPGDIGSAVEAGPDTKAPTQPPTQ